MTLALLILSLAANIILGVWAWDSWRLLHQALDAAEREHWEEMMEEPHGDWLPVSPMGDEKMPATKRGEDRGDATTQGDTQPPGLYAELEELQ